MRRVSAKYASPGMKLARDVYDNGGFQLFHQGLELTDEHVSRLKAYNVGEVIIDDWRVPDVPVLPMFAPEDEGYLVQALAMLIGESMGQDAVDPDLVGSVDRGISGFTRSIVPIAMGEINSGLSPRHGGGCKMSASKKKVGARVCPCVADGGIAVSLSLYGKVTTYGDSGCGLGVGR